MNFNQFNRFIHPMTLTLPLTTLALPPLIISLTKIAFNSGDTSLNGIVMGFPPLSAPVLLEMAIPCPPVALFGAVSLGGFTFRAPIIDLARSSWWFQLCFGICCSSGSGFICNESSDIDKKPQKPKGDRGGSTHYKQSIGNFKAETMRKCIEEIKRVESMPVPPGMKCPSRKEIAVSFGLSLSSVSSDIASLTFPWGCHLWPCLLFFLGFFFRSSRLTIEHLNWMALGGSFLSQGLLGPEPSSFLVSASTTEMITNRSIRHLDKFQATWYIYIYI